MASDERLAELLAGELDIPALRELMLALIEENKALAVRMEALERRPTWPGPSLMDLRIGATFPPTQPPVSVSLAPDWLERQAEAAQRHVASLPAGLRDQTPFARRRADAG